MISKATVPGRTHRLMQQNSHDCALIGKPRRGYAFGVVLDGCGSKHGNGTPSHNEVGAKLLGQFAAAFWQRELGTELQAPAHAQDDETFMAPLLDKFYREAIAFLSCIDVSFPWSDETARHRFVASHLLATLVGFVVTPETAAFFWQGDGCLVHNDEVILLDSQNRPDYLAYRILQPAAATKTAAAFRTRSVPRASLSCMAVATDGWQIAQLRQLATPQSSLQLQRWTNMQARERGSFEDDGAIAIWWDDPNDKTDDLHQ